MRNYLLFILICETPYPLPKQPKHYFPYNIPPQLTKTSDRFSLALGNKKKPKPMFACCPVSFFPSLAWSNYNLYGKKILYKKKRGNKARVSFYIVYGLIKIAIDCNSYYYKLEENNNNNNKKKRLAFCI